MAEGKWIRGKWLRGKWMRGNRRGEIVLLAKSRRRSAIGKMAEGKTARGNG
jgi:hypothetical protein